MTRYVFRVRHASVVVLVFFFIHRIVVIVVNATDTRKLSHARPRVSDASESRAVVMPGVAVAVAVAVAHGGGERVARQRCDCRLPFAPCVWAVSNMADNARTLTQRLCHG